MRVHSRPTSYCTVLVQLRGTVSRRPNVQPEGQPRTAPVSYPERTMSPRVELVANVGPTVDAHPHRWGAPPVTGAFVHALEARRTASQPAGSLLARVPRRHRGVLLRRLLILACRRAEAEAQLIAR